MRTPEIALRSGLRGVADRAVLGHGAQYYMRFAAIGTLGVVQLIPACGPDWDSLIEPPPVVVIDAAVVPRLPLSVDAGDASGPRTRTARAGGEDDGLIRGIEDAGSGDAGVDASVIIEKAR